MLNSILMSLGVFFGVFSFVSLILGKTFNFIELIFYIYSLYHRGYFDGKYHGREGQWDKELRESDYSEGFILERRGKPVAFWGNVLGALVLSIAGIAYPLTQFYR